MSLPTASDCLQSPTSVGSTPRPESGDGSRPLRLCQPAANPPGLRGSGLVPFRWPTRPPRTPRSRSLHSSPAANPSFLAYWPYPILNCLQFQPFVSISEIHPSSLSTHFIQNSIFSRPRTIHSLNVTLLNSTAASQNEVHYLNHPGLDPGGRPGWQRRASCSSPQDSHSLGASFAQRLWCRQFVCSSVFPFGCAV